LFLKVDDRDPTPAELLEQFTIFDMTLEQEDNSGTLSVHAQREVSVMLRERRKSDFNRMSYRKRASIATTCIDSSHIEAIKEVAEMNIVR
jgi:hypothetical protein